MTDTNFDRDGVRLPLIDSVIKKINSANCPTLRHLRAALLLVADPHQPGEMLASVQTAVIAGEALADGMRKAKQERLLPTPGIGRTVRSWWKRTAFFRRPLAPLLPICESTAASRRRSACELRVEQGRGRTVTRSTTKQNGVRAGLQHQLTMKGPGDTCCEPLAPFLPSLKAGYACLCGSDGDGIKMRLLIGQ